MRGRRRRVLVPVRGEFASPAHEGAGVGMSGRLLALAEAGSPDSAAGSRASEPERACVGRGWWSEIPVSGCPRGGRGGGVKNPVSMRRYTCAGTLLDGGYCPQQRLDGRGDQLCAEALSSPRPHVDSARVLRASWEGARTHLIGVLSSIVSTSRPLIVPSSSCHTTRSSVGSMETHPASLSRGYRRSSVTNRTVQKPPAGAPD